MPPDYSGRQEYANKLGLYYITNICYRITDEKLFLLNMIKYGITYKEYVRALDEKFVIENA